MAEFDFWKDPAADALAVAACVREIEELLGSLKERGPGPTQIDEALRQIMVKRGLG